MKKILGLDLGVSSIGWALVGEDGEKSTILALGSRIIPISVDDKNEFSSGNAISKNQKRTTRRTQRKGYDRYQLRRQYLIRELQRIGIMPPAEYTAMEKLALWGLRSNAVSEQISIHELGRVLLHLNQKRGYKSSRSDANMDKKDTDYVAEVKTRHQEIKEQRLTIGQYICQELIKDPLYRVKGKVFPREAYVEEFNAVLQKQQLYYPDILTQQVVDNLRDVIVYYQRPLKSQKGLVSICEFEGVTRELKDVEKNKVRQIFTGPRVAPRSSPLAQVTKLWESINNIRLTSKSGDEYYITHEQKQAVFDYLNDHERLSFTELLKILSLKTNDGYYGNKMLLKGIQGNLTRMSIKKCLGDQAGNLLIFNLDILRQDLVDETTGEIEAGKKMTVSREFEREPLYQLWHALYSIPDTRDLQQVLAARFGLDEETIVKLLKIDFSSAGYSNKSAKAMRKILPYLMEGWMYSEACSFAGYNHSDSITREANLKRQLADQLTLLKKNSIRQPIVEKILNQMIHQVNAIMTKYGRPDEIRIELARELKQSREERNETYSSLNKRERENDVIAKRLSEEFGIKATRNNIIKYRLFYEISGDESKVNATCIYCGKHFGITAALTGREVDIEHIIPKSKLFDDSQSNKTLSHRACNASKGDLTAYDYMKGKSREEFDDYINRVDSLYKLGVIRKSKRDKLLMTEKKIPTDFISRQLRETQYISRKAKEILTEICFDVWATSGAVTDYVKHVWGWDEVLMNLQLPKYREAGLTEWVEFEKDGQNHKTEAIKNWTKRKDHRHHAIDALTIACTKQGIIQKINTLSSLDTRDAMYSEVSDQNKNGQRRKSLLEAYVYKQRPFATREVAEKAAGILVSFKSGKRVATKGQRKVSKSGRRVVVQRDIVVPRGPLSEETVYGKIKLLATAQPVKLLFENPDRIVKPKIRKLVVERIDAHQGDRKQALRSLRKDPIWLDSEHTVPLTYGSIYQDQVVVKYPVSQIKAKDLESVIDLSVRQKISKRLEEFDGNDKQAYKNLDSDPIWFNEERSIPLRSVRCVTGLESVEQLKAGSEGAKSGFVKPGNNHHIAIYTDVEGRMVEHVCTFWHAVERVKFGIPVVITNSDEVWDQILTGKTTYPESFLSKLPGTGLSLKLSIQQNEMFILGQPLETVESALEVMDMNLLSGSLYRVQKLAETNYVFRHHLETEIDDSKESIHMKRFVRIRSLSALVAAVPIKVKVGRLGEIEKLDL